MFQTFFNGCNYPKGITALLCTNALIFLYMFGSFYVQNFIRKPKLSAAAKEKQEKQKQEKEEQAKENGHVTLNNNVPKEKSN